MHGWHNATATAITDLAIALQNWPAPAPRPLEMTNLADDPQHGAVRDELGRRLREFQARRGDELLGR